MWHRSVYNQTASDAWRYNNPVYKLMTDKLLLMLINVLLDQFLNTKVSQGSVATHLRCDGIVNNQFITQSLLSPRVKKFWKSVNSCRSYGQLSTGLFFLWNMVYIYGHYLLTCFVIPSHNIECAHITLFVLMYECAFNCENTHYKYSIWTGLTKTTTTTTTTNYFYGPTIWKNASNTLWKMSGQSVNTEIKIKNNILV